MAGEFPLMQEMVEPFIDEQANNQDDSEVTLTLGIHGPVNSSVASVEGGQPNLMDFDLFLPLNPPSMPIMPLDLIDLNTPAVPEASNMREDIMALFPIVGNQSEPNGNVDGLPVNVNQDNIIPVPEDNHTTLLEKNSDDAPPLIIESQEHKPVVASASFSMLQQDTSVLQVGNDMLHAAMQLQGNENIIETSHCSDILFPETVHVHAAALKDTAALIEDHADMELPITKEVTNHPSEDTAQNFPPLNETVNHEVSTNPEAGNYSGKTDAPPGFPFPLFRASHSFDTSMESEATLSKQMDAAIINQQGMELWEKHFAPLPEAPVVQVPLEWCNFIILALLSPDNFEWCKALLESQLWNIIVEKDNYQEYIQFHIPDTCPLSHAPACMQHEEQDTADSLASPLRETGPPCGAPDSGRGPTGR